VDAGVDAGSLAPTPVGAGSHFKHLISGSILFDATEKTGSAIVMYVRGCVRRPTGARRRRAGGAPGGPAQPVGRHRVSVLRQSRARAPSAEPASAQW